MELEKRIFDIQNEADFEACALDVFRFQAAHCEPYARWISYLGVQPGLVSTVKQIPFLPIQFFKTEKVYGAEKKEDIVFASSGTTGMQASHHFVAKKEIYEESFISGFTYFYGDPSEYTILALLPSYLERDGSSLIYMVKKLIKLSTSPQSGFFLHNHDDLSKVLSDLKDSSKPTVLFGVSFALLDFVEKYKINFPQLIVMETGGMKGRRRELPREELHQCITLGFGIKDVHSEYGMAELLSQAYSKGNGIFACPPWMKILIRDAYDPLSFVPNNGNKGGVNCIDLANIYSCSFIETQDLGLLHADNSFEILGRFDSSDIRGCNLLLEA